ncbi:PIN domain-containing protein [Brachybacterium sp. J153]|uniref:PIN domain-containing protein n=1 Tax=Brachybacterium sp. J153 TaxID=3116488 RepID=UPI002E78C3DD|nr:PIN domain-containing protein [Brachybacterium sp. J153]MEE1618729.1 PIN domain-containing protein [Brachybacterium sp. J153]
MSRPAILLDACTLVPVRLATTLLWLAEADLLTPLWSEQILDEVQRNLPSVAGISPAAAARRVSAMRDGFGAESMVEGHEGLVESMQCDPKDRHVLAAAVAARADVLATFNLRDFPAESTSPHGIAVLHPEQVLLQLLTEHPREVTTALESGVAAFRNPPQSLDEFLATLTRVAPTFANFANFTATLGEELSPIPALVEAPPEEALAAFGDPGDATRPEQVLFAWWCSLLDGDIGTARILTANPGAFGDYGWAMDWLAGRGLASRVLRAVDAPENLAFMRFVPETPTPVQVFAPHMAPSVIATLVRIEDGTWRVWGLGTAMPSAADVFIQR